METGVLYPIHRIDCKIETDCRVADGLLRLSVYLLYLRNGSQAPVRETDCRSRDDAQTDSGIYITGLA